MNHRTHEILDELADLFLTGPARSEMRPARAMRTPHRRVRPRGPAHATSVRVRVSDDLRQGTAPSTARAHGNSREPFALSVSDESQLQGLLAAMLDRSVILAARCPYQSLVRLMVDAQGRLHLWLARMESDVHAGIVSLIEARFWARDNIDLIALTQPDCVFDRTAEPILHLFTASRRTASILTGKLGPFFNLHLIESTPAPRASYALDDGGLKSLPSPRIVA